VAALLEGVGSGAVSNPVRDVEHSDLIIVIGSNPTANQPVAATWMKNAAHRGTRIVLVDPRIALAWIANELRVHGPGLHAGEVVTTGTAIVPAPIAPGDHFEADYGPLGRLSVSFAAPT
jgi:2-keto-4-pentenoate hydratase